MNNGMFSAMQQRSSAASAAPSYGAGVITDPRMLPQSVVNTIYYINSGNAQVALTAGIPPDHDGVAVTSTNVINILTVTGSGFLYDVISPNSDAGGTAIASVIITVDGVPYTISTSAALAAGTRFVLGPLLDRLTVSNPLILAKSGRHSVVNVAHVDTVNNISSNSCPRLRYERSLSVGIIMSAVPQVNGSYGNYASARYVRD